jgi:hypothetical protein
MKVPYGKPTKLTERRWARAKTPLFKEWWGLGDRGSHGFGYLMPIRFLPVATNSNPCFGVVYAIASWLLLERGAVFKPYPRRVRAWAEAIATMRIRVRGRSPQKPGPMRTLKFFVEYAKKEKKDKFSRKIAVFCLLNKAKRLVTP